MTDEPNKTVPEVIADGGAPGTSHDLQGWLFDIEAPEPLLPFRPTIEVSFTLIEGSCVYKALYDEYRVSSLEEAARRLFVEEGKQVFPGYRVYVEGFTPPFEYDACWPLRRRGSPAGVVERGLMQGAAPWDFLDDDTLVAFWEEPIGVWGTRSKLMLRVGGTTPRDAAMNWMMFAKALRALVRQVQADRHTRQTGAT